MIDLTLWENAVNSTGCPWQIRSWDELFARLSRADGPFLGDSEHPGWSPASFRDNHRAKADVVTVSALGLDYDGGTAQERIRELFGDYCGLAHSTRKSTPEAPRWRVVLPFSRPVSGFEFGELWKRLPSWVGEVDSQTKDASRLWYLPGSAVGAEHVVFELGGDSLLDPDIWLAKPVPGHEWRPRQHAPISVHGDVERRAVAYIAKMPEAISKQGGHGALWHVALTLAKGFGLGEERTLAILRSEYNHRCAPPWSEAELAHKARDAARAKLPDGYKLEDDWRRTAPIAAACAPAPVVTPEEPPGPGSSEREPGADDEEYTPAPPPLPIYSLRVMFMDAWEKAKTRQKVQGFTTGIGDVDALMCGLRRKHVSVIAAPTSWGKSSLAVMIADENLKRGERVLLVSAEDSHEMYGKRFIARRMRMNALALRNNDLKDPDIDRLGVAAVGASDDPVFYDAVGKPVEIIAEHISSLIANEGFGLVLCDYVQRFRSDKRTQDRRNEVTLVCHMLSDAIKNGNAAGVLFSQFKRIEGREPTMDDVKESGDVENMAEHVLLGNKKIGGKPYYEGDPPPFTRQIKIAKNKDGPVIDSWIDMKFNEVTASFETTAQTAPPQRKDEWDGVAEDRY